MRVPTFSFLESLHDSMKISVIRFSSTIIPCDIVNLDAANYPEIFSVFKKF